jgi:hypothetical protein
MPGRPIFEVDPQPELVAALKEAFGYFAPTDLGWWRVECTLKKVSREADQAGHEEFCRAFNSMIADDVIAFLVKHGLIEDRYQRAADGMNGNARKIIVGLFKYGATKQADATTRSEIENLTKLSAPQVKAAIEGEIRRASASLGAALLQGKSSFGTWLSAAGIEVAKRINTKIVKQFDT